MNKGPGRSSLHLKVAKTNKNVSVSTTVVQNPCGCVTGKGPAIGEIQVKTAQVVQLGSKLILQR